MIEIEFGHWWVIAAALGALDMLARRGTFLWLGVTALIVGLVVFVLPDLSWQAQCLIFAGLAVVVVVTVRLVVRRGGGEIAAGPFGRRGQHYIGQTLILESAIIGGRGRAFLDNTLWTLEGDDLPAGTSVKVVDTDGVALKVEPA